MAPDAPRVAGEHCKFCPAAPGCKEFADAAYAVAADVFGSTEILNGEELALVLRRAYVLKAWLKAMEVYAHAEAMAGRVPPGFKLVPKRATRKWKDDLAAEKFLFFSMGLGEGAFKKKLLSPAEADKVLKKRKAEAEPFYERVSSGTNLVPIDDEREPARPEVENVFEALSA
jgi:hypothetical protein